LNYRPYHIAKTLLFLLFSVASVQAGENGLAFLSKKIGLGPSLTPIPEKVERTATRVFAFTENGNPALTVKELKPLVDFVIAECDSDKAWRPKSRWDADGAAIMATCAAPIRKLIQVSLATNIPDAALFYRVLRYSAIVEMSDAPPSFFACTYSPLETNALARAQYVCIETTTPNQQSGACYSYTNTRTLVRANIDGRDVLVSVSDMHEPSTYSTRGVPLGPPQDGIYYYSEKLGINLPGVTWALSQMYVSKTLVIYVELPDNRTAVAMFSWLRAGWKGLNIANDRQIYEVLKSVVEALQTSTHNPRVTRENVARIVGDVAGMSKADVDKLYRKYCDYVKAWRDKKRSGLMRFRKSMLSKLYNDESLDKMPNRYRRALIMQERVRSLMGNPTWSAKAPPSGREHKYGYVDGV